MLEDLLELILITYNRDSYLDKTLEQLLDSPFKNCKITILDNCSPDNTQEICKKYVGKFPNMIIKRHNINIGGNANILRAVETSTSYYTWIVGDNDDYDFTVTDDVIEAIESKKYDIIDICSPMLPTTPENPSDESLNQLLDKKNKIEGTDKTSTREIYTQELIDIMQGNFFMDMAFISGYIYRTSIYDTEAMIHGYDNIPNFFPHFVLINKAVENNYFIYKSERDLVIQRENPQNDSFTYTFTKFYDGWLNSALMIKDSKYRKICYQNLDNHSLTTNNYLIVLPVAVMVDKATGRPDIKNNLISLIAVLYKHSGWIKGLFISLLLLLVYVVPSGIYKRLYEPMYNREQEKLKNK